MTKYLAVACLLTTLVFLPGCGGQTKSTSSKNAQSDATEDTLKPRLEDAAKSGFLGSAAAGMKDAIEALPTEKSGPLLKDYEELMKAKSPDQVKAIAKRMIEKL